MPFSAYSSAVLAPIGVADLVPPPRFAAKSFADYRIDATVAGQAAAVAEVRAFALHNPGFFAWFRKAKAGLYLDGGFGTGKTHLLAASFHAAPGTKRYLSFAEAMSLLTVRGKDAAIDLLTAELVCIDEFELDDPTNTRLADLLITGLMERKSRIITTSNTVPGELGQGRMAVDLFRTQLARLEAVFSDVHVPGSDYRQRQSEAGHPPTHWGATVEPLPGQHHIIVSAAELDRWLSNIPVINLRRVAAALTHLSIVELQPFENQLAALRFVHLVDKLYDYAVPLRIRSTAAIADIFPPEHCQASFAKKYRRCQSRLAELCA